MNIKETIEDDDICAHRDLDLDIERCSKAIEVLKFQQEYQDKVDKCIERIEKATTICPIGTIVNFGYIIKEELKLKN